MIRSHKPVCIVLDIETAPMVAYAWGRKDINIALNQIKEEWKIMAVGMKILGEKKVHYVDTFFNTERRLLEVVWKWLDKADIVITQNGKSFDIPKLNAKFILYGMERPSPYRQIDTYRLAKSVAAFTSYKLEYLTEKLCTKYRKLSHNKFPGMSLWTECLASNPKAWKEMKLYNTHDVLSTEELYLKLRGWAPASVPSPSIPVQTSPSCPFCTSYNLRSLGIRTTSFGKYRRYICSHCGTSTKGELYS